MKSGKTHRNRRKAPFPAANAHPSDASVPLVAPAIRRKGATAINAPETLRSKVPAAAVPRSNPQDSTVGSLPKGRPANPQGLPPPPIAGGLVATCLRQGTAAIIALNTADMQIASIAFGHHLLARGGSVLCQNVYGSEEEPRLIEGVALLVL